MTYATEKVKVGRKPLIVVEIDLDTCSNVFGNALTSPITGTCTASGASGTECYNTRFTCQDSANFTKATKTYRFCEPVQQLPAGVEMIPSIVSVALAPTKITSEFGLGHRASITVTIQDHPHHDRGYDPYVANRTYTPETQGTFWGKLRARTPYYQGRTMRIRSGYLGTDNGGITDSPMWSGFESREYVIEEIRGPDASGRVQIVGKDVLKLADDDRSKAPNASEGELQADITNVQTTMNVLGGTYTDPATSPVTNQWVRIGDELIKYTGLTGTGADGDPWVFSGLVRTDVTWGSASDSHSEGDLVQQCLAYEDVNVRDIIDDLLVNYAGISSAYIVSADWDAEEAQWYSTTNLTGIVSEPTGVDELVAELQEQTQCNIWWDEIAQEVKFKAIAPPVGILPTILTDDSEVLADSLSVKDKPKDRVSQVWIYYDKTDHTKDDIGNYKKLYIQTDTEAESATQYNDSRIYEIKSRWFDATNNAAVAQTAARMLSARRDNPREIKFSLDAKDSGVVTGDIVQLNLDDIQGADGAQDSVLVLIQQAKEAVHGHRWDYVGITGVSESRFGNISWPTTQSPIMGNYTAESEANQLAYAFICDSSTLKMSNGDDSYKII